MLRHMITECNARKEPVGFLDPQLVSKQQIEGNKKRVFNYVVVALLAQQNKEFILLPYNQEYVCFYTLAVPPLSSFHMGCDIFSCSEHWILLIIIPKWSKAIHLDSLQASRKDYSAIRKFLDSAFAEYVNHGGRYSPKGNPAVLQHGTDDLIKVTIGTTFLLSAK